MSSSLLQASSDETRAQDALRQTLSAVARDQASGRFDERTLAAAAQAAARQGDFATALDLLGRLDPFSERRGAVQRELEARAPRDLRWREFPRALGASRDALRARLLRETLQGAIPLLIIAGLCFALLLPFALIGRGSTILILLFVNLGFVTNFLVGKSGLQVAYQDPERAPDPVPPLPTDFGRFFDSKTFLAILCCQLPFVVMAFGQPLAVFALPAALILAGGLCFASQHQDGAIGPLLLAGAPRNLLLDAGLIGGSLSLFSFLTLSLVLGTAFGILLASFCAFFPLARAMGFALRRAEIDQDLAARRAAPLPEV